MPSRKLSDLTPECQAKATEFALLMHDNGNQFIFTQTLRTKAEQIAYYARGRKSLNEVNALYRAAGLAEISAKENESTVTKTMNSKHLTGNAFDIAIIVDGVIIWNDKDTDGNGVTEYEEAARIAETIGLKAGKRFGDAPHFELITA